MQVPATRACVASGTRKEHLIFYTILEGQDDGGLKDKKMETIKLLFTRILLNEEGGVGFGFHGLKHL